MCKRLRILNTYVFSVSFLQFYFVYFFLILRLLIQSITGMSNKCGGKPFFCIIQLVVIGRRFRTILLTYLLMILHIPTFLPIVGSESITAPQEQLKHYAW